MDKVYHLMRCKVQVAGALPNTPTCVFHKISWCKKGLVSIKQLVQMRLRELVEDLRKYVWQCLDLDFRRYGQKEMNLILDEWANLRPQKEVDDKQVPSHKSTMIPQ